MADTLAKTVQEKLKVAPKVAIVFVSRDASYGLKPS